MNEGTPDLLNRFVRLLERFRSDERGAFLVIFGVMAIVLVATSGAVVDFTSIEQARTRAQVALDSAALGLQPRIYDTPAPSDESLRLLAQNLMRERMGANDVSWNICAGTGVSVLPCVRVDAAETDTADGTLRLEASMELPMSFVSLVGVESMRARLVAQAARGSVDVEVAVALDATGSMSGQKIKDLRDATAELIDIIVQDQQEPTYSKMALVPYSMGVNVADYAEQVRGPIAPGKAITNAAWAVSGSARDISGISKDYPARVTTRTNHGYSTGDTIYLSGVGGMTSLNNQAYRITRIDNRRFDLNGVNSSPWYFGYYSYGGTTQECINSPDCDVTITSASHGFSTGDYVHIIGVNNMPELNNGTFRVQRLSRDTFSVPGGAGGSYASGGTAYCTTPGCEYYLFQNAQGNWKVHRVSTCVTERTTNAATDAAPSTTYLGRNYPSASGGNPCIANAIVPLSSNKWTLKQTAANLAASGSTAGHIGLAWAWYMLSPNFGYLWPEASRPAAYGKGGLIKAVILMTDGAFNTVYCEGVIARNSTTGSGSTADHNSCNAPNGGSYGQAVAQCDAMKAAGLVVYTVGFDIGTDANAISLMTNCATSSQHAHLAATGTDLKEAFRTIGRNISRLRLSQ